MKNSKYNFPAALIIGNEVNGFSQIVANLTNSVIEIPQFGTKHSLNISVSVDLILWKMMKS